MAADIRGVVEAQRGILERLQAGIQVVDTPEYANYVNFADSYQRPIQRWMRYREGFSPPLVESLLGTVLRVGGSVVDPFCGSGTTLFVASRAGYQAVGVDTNPVATFAAEVKTEVYTPEDVLQFEQAVRDLLSGPVVKPTLPKPGLKIIDKVFQPEILDRLLMYREAIQRRQASSTSLDGEQAVSGVGQGKVYGLLFLGWVAILERVSNTYKEGNGIKYRRGRTPILEPMLPGLEHPLLENCPSTESMTLVERALAEQYQGMLDDLRTDLAEHRKRSAVRPQVYRGSALTLEQFIPLESVGCVITSPPYPNCFDYTSIFKVELWTGGFVQSYAEMNNLRHLSVRSHANAQLRVPQQPKQASQTIGDEETAVDRLVSLMDISSLWDRRIPLVVRGYFEDMKAVLAQVQRILVPGGKCMMVVGSSAYSNVIFPTDLLLAEAALKVGLQVERIAVARHLTTSSQQKKNLERLSGFLRESVLMLRKP